jgi:hypothetical protein
LNDALRRILCKKKIPFYIWCQYLGMLHTFIN